MGQFTVIMFIDEMKMEPVPCWVARAESANMKVKECFNVGEYMICKMKQLFD